MSGIPSKNPMHRPSSSFVDATATPHNPTLLSPPETDPMQDQFSTYEEHYSPPDQVVHETPVSRIRRLGMPHVTYTNGGLTSRETKSSQRQSRWLITVFPPKSLNKEPPTLGHTLSSAPAGRFSNGILMPLFPTLYAQLTAIAREFNMPSTTGLCVYLQLQENSNSQLTPRISDETWHILWASYFTDDRPAHAPSHGLPICGRIEFDIDLRRAKWYNTWMGFTLEAISREPSVVPSHWRGESRTSFFHPELISANDDPSLRQEITLPNSTRRQAPRPLFLEKRESLHQRSSSRNSIRNIVQQDVPDHENLLPAMAAQTFVPNALSPMVQELEEPQSSTSLNINAMVKKWRENSVIASVAPSIVDPSGHDQLSLDPVILPSSNPVAEVELDLNDFSWSVSSAGPSSQSPATLGWSERLPSIHLADRMQASRCNTPTTCTSWGPSTRDGDIFIESERQNYHLPSPDIGRRILEFIPLTPSTCTSWGPDDLPSPVFSHPSVRALSIDVGARAAGSVPVTPSTCTTWGPADVPSPSLSLFSFENLSVDLASRRRGSVPVTPSTATSWGPADTPMLTPQTPIYLPSPHIGERVFNDLEEAVIENRSGCWQHVWPYNQRSVPSSSASIPWAHVWPYVQSSTVDNVPMSSEYTPPVEVTFEHYPALRTLYSLQVEKSIVSSDVQLLRDSAPSYPFSKVYDSVYPYNLSELYPEVSSTSTGANSLSGEPVLAMSFAVVSYPSLVIYPPVYPYNLELIYPAISTPTTPSLSSEAVGAWNYPLFEIYPSIDSIDYLQKTRSPVDHTQMPLSDVHYISVTATTKVAYPKFDLYPSVYPFSLDSIYPEIVDLRSLSGAENNVISYGTYPSFAIYPEVYPFNLTDIYHSASSQAALTEEAAPRLGVICQYPVFDLYPSVYPFNLMEIYPVDDVNAVSLVHNPSVLIEPQYPSLEIYPAVYPYSLTNIYPTVPPGIIMAEDIEGDFTFKNQDISSLESQYSFSNIYPQSSDNLQTPVTGKSVSDSILDEYPLITLYGTIYGKVLEKSSFETSILSKKPNSDPDSMAIYPEASLHVGDVSMSLAQLYPMFDLYPLVYPFNLEKIYPSTFLLDDLTSPPTAEQQVAIQTTDYGVYPHLTIYPAGYPWSLGHIYNSYGEDLLIGHTDLSIADEWPLDDDSEEGLCVTRYAQGYPTFALYPPSQGYPDFVLYPQVWNRSVCQEEGKAPAITAISASYPTFNLYPPLYPFITVYPDIAPTMKYPESSSFIRLVEHREENVGRRYPFLDVYPSVYPHFDLYPKMQPVVQYYSPSLSKPDSSGGIKPEELSDYETGLQAAKPFLAHSPPPIPSKPKALRSSLILYRSDSLKQSKSLKPRRTHYELYMAVIDDVQRALEEQSTFEATRLDSEENQSLRTSSKPSLFRKPSVASRYTPSPIGNRTFPMQSVGLPSSPSPTRTASTFTGHVSTSIHNRVQSLSKPKEGIEKHGPERSRSLSDRTRSIVHDRARMYSVPDGKNAPPLPNKPLFKSGKPSPTSISN